MEKKPMAKHSYRDSHKTLNKGSVYDAHSQDHPWRRYIWSREQEILLAILSKYLGHKDIDLLDFACGTGRVTGFLENHVKKSTGVDVSESMLEVAREKLKCTEIIQADITVDNVLRGRKFNLITAFRFFLNAEPELRLAAIKGIAGLLAKDGYLVFNNHRNLGSPWVKFSYMRHRQDYTQRVCNAMTIQEMNDLVAHAGLEIIEIYAAGFFYLPKVPVLHCLNRVMDSVAAKSKWLTRFSESPVAVCRWKKR